MIAKGSVERAVSYQISNRYFLRYSTQFNSVEERDAYLKKELRTLQRQIAEAEEQQKEIERSMTEDGEEEDQIAEEIRVGLEIVV